jgi:exosortase E/protease (VPEID-CTERM system)
VLVFAAFSAGTGWTFTAFESTRPALALGVVGLWGLGALLVPVTAALVVFEAHALRGSSARLLPSLLLASGIGVAAFALSRIVLAVGLWEPLLAATTWLAAAILTLLPGSQVQVEFVAGQGYSLALDGFSVLVTSLCSGVEGVALIWTFLAAYSLAFRRSLRFPQALVLLPIATLLVWVLNAVRLAVLVWIGERVSAEVALQGFHSYAGWIVFCGLALGVVYVSQRVPWLAAQPRVEGAVPATGTVNPAALYLGPFLAVLATSFVTGAFSHGFDALYPLRVLAGAAVLWWARAELPRVRRELHATGVLFGVAAFVLWIGLERLGLQTRESRTPRALAELTPLAAGIWIAFRVLGFVVLAPLTEELAFRGFLARRLVGSDFEAVAYRALTPFAWALSSLAFGLLHGQWLAGTLTGALFGLAAMRRGRLGDAIVAHTTTNALLIAYWLALGPWHGWL